MVILLHLVYQKWSEYQMKYKYKLKLLHKGIYPSKALSCMKLFLYKKCLFIKERDTFGHNAVWTIYTSHIDHFRPKNTVFEQSAACLSVFLELLPGLIPFAILWHAGWTLEKTICMNMNYNYLTAIFGQRYPSPWQKSNYCLYRKIFMQVKAFEKYIPFRNV